MYGVWGYVYKDLGAGFKLPGRSLMTNHSLLWIAKHLSLICCIVFLITLLNILQDYNLAACSKF